MSSRKPTLSVFVPMLVTAAMALAPGVHAQEAAPTYDRVTLSASAGREVANDLLVAELYAQQEGTDAAGPAGEVNRRIQWALERSKRTDGIEIQTLDYHTSPIYRDQRLAGWRVRQALRLESTDAERLSALIGDLQERLAVRSIGYRVSPGALDAAESALVAAAIAAFQARADQVAEHFGRPGWRLVEAHVSSTANERPPMVMARGAALRAEAASPTLEAGTERVEIRVNGTVELAVD